MMLDVKACSVTDLIKLITSVCYRYRHDDAVPHSRGQAEPHSG